MNKLLNTKQLVSIHLSILIISIYIGYYITKDIPGITNQYQFNITIFSIILGQLVMLLFYKAMQQKQLKESNNQTENIKIYPTEHYIQNWKETNTWLVDNAPQNVRNCIKEVNDVMIVSFATIDLMQNTFRKTHKNSRSFGGFILIPEKNYAELYYSILPKKETENGRKSRMEV